MDSELKVYIISGCCGVGKTTLAEQLVKRMPKTALISGDDVHDFYRDEISTKWEDRLALTWQNILLLVNNFLINGINVIVDYVVEDELGQLLSVVSEYDVEIRYVVLTANIDVIEQSLVSRGDAYLVERAMYLRKKLTEYENNKPYLYDGTNIDIEKQVDDIAVFKLYAV